MKAPAQTPCLGARVSALADGSLRDDVRDRALAHTLTCRSCRDALDVERLTLARLRSLPGPAPSAGLMASLYALGEPGGPVPPRRAPFGPGMAPPPVVPLGRLSGVRSAPPGVDGSVRPGGTSRPYRAGERRRRRTSFVAAAGALGVSFVAAGMLSGTSPLTSASTVDLTASLGARPSVAPAPPPVQTSMPVSTTASTTAPPPASTLASYYGASYYGAASLGGARLGLVTGSAGFTVGALPSAGLTASPLAPARRDAARQPAGRPVPTPAVLAGLAHAR